MTDNRQHRSPKPGFFMRLFWKACGADRSILEQCDYREHVKYACLGGIVVATGLMAGIAGGYAFYTIFEPNSSALETGTDLPVLWISLGFGIIWGAMIFNLDRFIVTSTGQGDGSEKITRDEFVGAIPRIIMGIIIAITISKPLEIRIFKSEIDVRLVQEQMDQQQAFIASIDKRYAPEVTRIETEQDLVRQKTTEIQERYRQTEIRYLDEMQNRDHYGNGPVAKSIKAQLDDIEKELKIKENEQKELAEKFKDLQAEIDEQKAKKEDIANGLDGLLERIKLSHEIAGWQITLFITLLFVAIELTPIFFKLMLIKSPYDFLSDNQKELIKAQAGIEVKYNYYKDKEGIEKDLVIFHEVLRQTDEQDKLTKAQLELNDYIVNKWLEREKKKVDENLDQYINATEHEAT
jgi:hypothetical protein